jgi:hypothetical protein
MVYSPAGIREFAFPPFECRRRVGADFDFLDGGPRPGVGDAAGSIDLGGLSAAILLRRLRMPLPAG